MDRTTGRLSIAIVVSFMKEKKRTTAEFKIQSGHEYLSTVAGLPERPGYALFYSTVCTARARTLHGHSKYVWCTVRLRELQKRTKLFCAGSFCQKEDLVAK
jgi:hypothetical protein